MRHVRQRPNGCAPAALAIVAGVELDVARYALGRGAIDPRRLVVGLGRLGWRADRLRILRGRMPPRHARGLLLMPQEVRTRERLGHVAVLAGDGRVFDPALARPVPLERYQDHMRRMRLWPVGWLPVRRAG